MLHSFCINECIHWIISNKFSKIGVEFTDSLHHAPHICMLLKKETGLSPIVLESSNRACGNCCTDEGTAKYRNIEAVIHFGRTCLTPTRLLPVLYVLYPDIAIDCDVLSQKILSEETPKKTEDLILVYDILCTPSIALLFNQLKKHFPHLVLSTLVIPPESKLVFLEENPDTSINEDEGKSSCNTVEFHSRKVHLEPNKTISDYNFIYIGPNSLAFEPLKMRFSDRTFYVLDPTTNSLTVSNYVKSVMGRSKKIEQVKEATSFGLINTVVKGHQEITSRLKKLILSSKKRYYSFFMGRINEAKLANIVGVDVFVYIGCAESSLFDRIENTYLYKNIVTPWEVEVALNPSTQWSLNFETNFRELFKGDLQSEKEIENTSISPEEKYEESSSALLLRNTGAMSILHLDEGAQAFRELSWQGLNPQEESEVTIGTVIEGRKGIAMEYNSEIKN